MCLCVCVGGYLPSSSHCTGTNNTIISLAPNSQVPVPLCLTLPVSIASYALFCDLQRDIYDQTVAPLVEAVMEGYNGTCFAYGQTGAGKSHTMEGYPDPPELRGIIPNSFRHIFEKIDWPPMSHT